MTKMSDTEESSSDSDGDSQHTDIPGMPYEIRMNDEVGRFLVAARDVPARAIIIREAPLVCGPADDDRDYYLGEIPMCLGCFARLSSNQESRCSKCAWPVCGVACENICHHAENECRLFADNHVVYPPRHTWPIVNKSILVLRCLLLKHTRQNVWEDVILRLESHTHIRNSKPYCVKADEMILDNLREILFDIGIDYDEEEIIRISGVINVNAFNSLKFEKMHDHLTIAQCLFSESSLMAHSCIPNAMWSVGNCPTFEMTVRATVPIKKGEPICIAYSNGDNLVGTLQRQIATEDVAHFVCKCRRCSDPTELGTFLSAVTCFSCGCDFLLPVDPLRADSHWRCVGCHTVQSVQRVVSFLSKIEERFEDIKSQGYSKEREVLQLQDLYDAKQNVALHKNHFILQQISLRIVNLLAFSVHRLDDDQLDRFIFHCQCLLNVADVLAPGYCQHRSLHQFFLAQGLLMKARGQLAESMAGGTEVDYEVEANLQKLCMQIYNLQLESLIYFENSHNYTPSDGINQYVTSIREQMEEICDFLGIDVGEQTSFNATVSVSVSINFDSGNGNESTSTDEPSFALDDDRINISRSESDSQSKSEESPSTDDEEEED